MTKYPLFGQDSVPEYTSKFLALIGTGVFWLVLLIIFIFAKPITKKPKYKTVQIVLSSTPVMEKQKENIPDDAASKTEVVETPAPAKIEQKSEPKVETPKAAPKPDEKAPAPKPKTEPINKTEPKKVVEKTVPKTETKPAVTKTPEPVKLAKSVEDSMEEQWNQTKKSDFDWSKMDDDFDDTPVEATKTVTPTPAKSSFSGSSGQVEKEVPQQVNNNQTSKKSTTQASSSTKSDLAKIENETGAGNSSAKSDTVANKKASAAENAVDNNFKWTAGTPRKLVIPKNPKIDISKENQDKINFNEVRLTFTVDSNGYIIRNTVSPSPMIPQAVLDEILDQLGDWWFDSGSSNATATFIWKIQRN